MPPSPCASICSPAARAISQLCVTLTSMMSRNCAGFMSTIFAPRSCPRRRRGCRRGRSASPPPATIAAHAASLSARRLTASTSAPSSRHSAADLVERLLAAGDQDDLGAGAGEHLGGERAERAGGADDDRHLAGDVEQRERIREGMRSRLRPRRIGDDHQHGADAVLPVDELAHLVRRDGAGIELAAAPSPCRRRSPSSRRRGRHRPSRTASSPARRRRRAGIATGRPTGWSGRPPRSPAAGGRRRRDGSAPRRAWRRRSA